MAIYDGVVTLDENDIPVMVELDHDHIRMSAAGTEIGEWRTEECLITQVEEATYDITAEDETIRFVPNQPRLFAAAVNGDRAPVVAMPPPPEPVPAGDGVPDAPPPQPITVGLFYGLCFVTIALAVWALASMVF